MGEHIQSKQQAGVGAQRSACSSLRREAQCVVWQMGVKADGTGGIGTTLFKRGGWVE